MKTIGDDRGLLEALLSDGRFWLSLTSFVLALSGGSAIFQSFTGYFLPQDVHALGFDAQHLAAMANPHVVKFMFHDRVAFGGTLLAIGVAYWYLAEFPMRAGAPWAVKEAGVKLDGRLELMFVPDEETGGARGSLRLVDAGVLGAEGIGMLTPEPSSGSVWNANRGALSLRITVRGKPAHVGLHFQGANAFEGMIAAANKLLDLKREVELR